MAPLCSSLLRLPLCMGRQGWHTGSAQSMGRRRARRGWAAMRRPRRRVGLRPSWRWGRRDAAPHYVVVGTGSAGMHSSSRVAATASAEQHRRPAQSTAAPPRSRRSRHWVVLYLFGGMQKWLQPAQRRVESCPFWRMDVPNREVLESRARTSVGLDSVPPVAGEGAWV